MNIHMSNISFGVTRDQLKIELAKNLHDAPYTHLPGLDHPMNFEVIIYPRRGRYASGSLTVPSAAVGGLFLFQFSGPGRSRTITLRTTIRFELSNKPSPSHVIHEVQHARYEDPRAKQERDRLVSVLRTKAIPLSTIQFGWECRDNVFSVEWERQCRVPCELIFLEEAREFRIKLYQGRETRIIVIKAAHIMWSSAGMDKSERPHRPVVFLSLANPPMFETEMSQIDMTIQHMENLKISHNPSHIHGEPDSTSRPLPRNRWSQFEDGHIPYVPFTSHSIRLVCASAASLKLFRDLCSHANMQPNDFLYPVEHRELFAPDIQATYAAWVARLPWRIAFQIEALTRGLSTDLKEALALQKKISTLMRQKGIHYTALFLRQFITQANLHFHYTDDTRSPTGSIVELFSRLAAAFTPPAIKRNRSRGVSNDDVFDCFHVTVTPSSYRLSGPHPERSNRVVRSYPNHHDCFLRVGFVDETGLQYRFERDVDLRSFIQRRVGSILRDGLDIAGRHFEFLAYSQSALKEHTVWFVKEFTASNGDVVNAQTIIAGLGNFGYDPELMLCPARYGARISQAFTATDTSVSVDPEEIFVINDILDPSGRWNFTDGVGTMSTQLARQIWRALAPERHGQRWQTFPRALQVRFQGSKGMLSVDHTLSGRLICLRPSMIKFEALSTTHVEIARAFNRPGPLYLNRPLIMILEALGVQYEVFHDLQRSAVRAAQESVVALNKSAHLLEVQGLGASFRLASVMLNLHKLGLGPLSEDKFWHRLMDFAINHTLRELKHRARIPVPDAWNLVGVADVHGYLKPGEVFGCIIPQDGTGPIYLQGRILITRSPTIHPGDVRVAWGIGRPPRGSPFEKESLRNTLVLPIRGNRPIQTCLGGGDLDGDEYCVTMLPSLVPKTVHQPANYTPAEKNNIHRRSTMQDVADFVTEYITSDSLGIIATTWLKIADRSPDSIFDSDCLILAALHSDAVDYPKTGYPVPLDRIPRYRWKTQPDWSAPETIPTAVTAKKYYKSTRAIGKLYRDIDLPLVEAIHLVEKSQRSRLREDQKTTLDDILDAFYSVDLDLNHEPVYSTLANRVSHFVSIEDPDDDLIAEIWELYCSYALELQTICTDYTLSSTPGGAMLTEEEVVVGTIVAKCSQQRKRRDLMSKMRERATMLVDSVRYDLSGEEETPRQQSLERAWVAYRLASFEGMAFGAQSFAWIAMGEIFDAIKLIEDSASTIRSRRHI